MGDRGAVRLLALWGLDGVKLCLSLLHHPDAISKRRSEKTAGGTAVQPKTAPETPREMSTAVMGTDPPCGGTVRCSENKGPALRSGLVMLFWEQAHYCRSGFLIKARGPCLPSLALSLPFYRRMMQQETLMRCQPPSTHLGLPSLQNQESINYSL